MQIDRAVRAALLVLAVLVCLAFPTPQQALAQEIVPPDTSQTKTDPPQPSAADASPTQAAETLTLTPIRDDGGTMAVAVLPGWNDVAQGPWLLEDAPAGNRLSASPDQAEFAANWGTPGITVYYSTSLPATMEPEDVLAIFDFSGSCQNGGRASLPPGERSVTYQIWQNCTEAGTAAAVLVIYPTATRAYYGVVEVYLTAADQLRALAPILASVQFNPSPAPAIDPAAPGGDSPASDPAAGPESGPAPTLAAAAPTALPTAAPAIATVITDRLNLRGGPSTEAERLTVLTRGVQLTVVGQVDNCAWLRVDVPDSGPDSGPSGAQGWVSGDPQFTQLQAACETIPPVENP